MFEKATPKKNESKGKESVRKASSNAHSKQLKHATVKQFLNIQQTMGNQAVLQMMRERRLQLKVGGSRGRLEAARLLKSISRKKDSGQNKNDGNAFNPEAPFQLKDSGKEQSFFYPLKNTVQGKTYRKLPTTKLYRHTKPSVFQKKQVVQRKLKLVGDKGPVDDTIDILNGGLFNYTASVDGKGYVILTANDMVGPPSPKQTALYNRLANIVNDPTDTSIAVSTGSKEVIVGSYELEAIDIGDIKAFGEGEGTSALSALIHEIEEQYQKQVKGKGYEEAHEKGGVVAEVEMSGATRGKDNVLSITQNKDGTIDAVIEVPYTYPDGKVVIVKTTLVKNNITKVERRAGP